MRRVKLSDEFLDGFDLIDDQEKTARARRMINNLDFDDKDSLFEKVWTEDDSGESDESECLDGADLDLDEEDDLIVTSTGRIA